MNKLKSFFVTPYMMTALGLTIFALYRLGVDGISLGYIGVLLTTAPFMAVLGRMMLFGGVARTSGRMPIILILGAAGVVLAAFDYTRTTGATTLPLGLAVAGFTGFLLYDFWYSSFARQPSPSLSLGGFLPDFTLEDINGSPVQSSALRGQPTVLLFYRGNWCPLCMAQIQEIAAGYRALAERGVQVALVSPQSHEQTKELAKRHETPFIYLVDRDNRAANALGIAVADGVPFGIRGYDADTVMPTVVITDATGKIIFLDETDNYRVRPEPSRYLAALDEAA